MEKLIYVDAQGRKVEKIRKPYGTFHKTYKRPKSKRKDFVREA